ncbi:iron-sulfur cluster insertion protein ErpA [Oligoflexia bacterium]|nr:iron-sulfur cluster insertion protein ErpA [Oligoflexia bacterium]
MNENENTGQSASDDTCSGSEQPLQVTPAAITAIKDAFKQEGNGNSALRVSVLGGGCAGYQYNLDFEEATRDDDTLVECDGVRLCVDPISANLLSGTVIDYVSGLNGTGFKFDNPNANRTCGCGHSFG